MRQDPRYRGQVTSAFIKLIGISSALHDIGKVGVSDSILLKPGKLGRQEWPKMQLHAAIGGRCIREIESRLGRSNFLQMAREIAFGHHEHWDGTGYPKGLAGEEIPLAARIVAIVDVYDALSTKRIYKEAIPHEKCVDMIREGAGLHFDPYLVQIFLKLEPEFRQIARNFKDIREAQSAEAAAAEEAPAIPAAAGTPIEDEFEVLQSLLDQCTDDSLAASVGRAYRSSAAARRSNRYSAVFPSDNDSSATQDELEPENVP